MCRWHRRIRRAWAQRLRAPSSSGNARSMRFRTSSACWMAGAVLADVTALHLAREALSTINLELESRVRLRTDALADANRDLQNEIVRREAAEQALRRSRNELATLSRQLITAQEMERKRIARELHDSVGQQLSAIKYGLER